eukprot:scaffold24402_cov27-Prasinocladus_malaysianus.AAC.1
MSTTPPSWRGDEVYLSRVSNFILNFLQYLSSSRRSTINRHLIVTAGLPQLKRIPKTHRALKPRTLGSESTPQGSEAGRP